MKNCEHCRWRMDLVRADKKDDKTIWTIMDGFVCIAPSIEGHVHWLCGMSDFNTVCGLFEQKED